MSEEKPPVSWKYPKVFEGYKVVTTKPALSTQYFSFLVVDVDGEELEGYFCNNCRKNARVNEKDNRIFCYWCTNNGYPMQEEIPKEAGSFQE